MPQRDVGSVSYDLIEDGMELIFLDSTVLKRHLLRFFLLQPLNMSGFIQHQTFKLAGHLQKQAYRVENQLYMNKISYA